MAELMRGSRLVLNTNFGAGLARAAVLGLAGRRGDLLRPQRRLRPGLPGLGELFFWQGLDGALDGLVALANDPERCWTYACGAKSEILAHHTWDQRIDLILAAACAVRR
jgi:hypothetical protein